MKRNLLKLIPVIAGFFFINNAIGQQIPNSDFELWENVASAQEPNNWNSFLTAQGTWSGFAQNQLVSSTDVRPGSSGTKSAKLNALSIVGTLANGTLTLGRINMGSTTPASVDNYNISLTADGNFSEAFTATPDSIVFWAKYIPGAGSATDQARMKASFHGNFNCKDPEDAASTAQVDGTCIRNFNGTNNQWVRFSTPVDYSGVLTSHSYVLITFATNKTPGAGNAGDLLYIDDLEMIYNPTTNQQIVANNDSYTGNQDNAITCTVLTNDVDPENAINNASLSIVTQPTNGSAVVVGSSIIYSPTIGFAGTDNFSYQICDGGSPATCDIATVTLNLNAVGIAENSIKNLEIKSIGNALHFVGSEKMDANYVVYNLTGSIIQKGKIAPQVSFNEKAGVYLISVVSSTGTVTKRIYKN